MPIKLGRRLQSWLLRSGAPISQQPLPYSDFVQPVEIVGEGSRLTAPILPPSAVAGSDQLIVGIASNYSCQLQSLSPGGAYIVEFQLSGNFNAAFHGWSWWISTSGTSDPAMTLCPAFNQVPGNPVASIFKTGQPAALLQGQFQPMFFSGAPNHVTTLRDLYVPPGHFFLLESNTSLFAANDLVAVQCQWWEFTEPQP